MSKKEKMIQQHLKGRDITNERVLKAMTEVDREVFIPEGLKSRAYEDCPLPIGHEQTISQPYIVAYMAQVLDLQPHEKVLEIGTGSGYNAAILAKLSKHVYSIEVIDWLSDLAKFNLEKAGVKNVTVKQGDGYYGWPKFAPFDKIMLTAATPWIPDQLKEQLKIGGKLMVPLSNSYQKLIITEKTGANSFIEHDLIYVNFVPLTGESQV